MIEKHGDSYFWVSPRRNYNTTGEEEDDALAQTIQLNP